VHRDSVPIEQVFVNCHLGNRDFHFGFCGRQLSTPRSMPARPRLSSSHVRPVLKRRCLGALSTAEPVSSNILPTGRALRRFFARCPWSALACYRQCNARIRRSISPNSRRWRCPSAKNNQ
jgi:hypothetical protein